MAANNTVSKHMVDTHGLLDAIRMYVEPIASYTATDEDRRKFFYYDCHTVKRLINILDERLDAENDMTLEVEEKYAKISSKRAQLDGLIGVLNAFKIEPLDDEED